MNSNVSTRFLLVALAVLIVAVCVYALFAALGEGRIAGHGWDKRSPPLTVEEKAEVVRSLSQSTTDNTDSMPTTKQERQRILENVAQSSSDASSMHQDGASKLKVLGSLH